MNGHQDEDIRRLERVITKVESLERDIATGYAEIRADLEKMQVDLNRISILMAGQTKEFALMRWLVFGFAALVLSTFGALIVNLVFERPAP